MSETVSKKLVLGILAHVDAGKTTLAEGFLYIGGKIRALGRVDHKDAFLDNFALERERGITIFSKQAQITLGDVDVTLLDTPGHVDFSAEMERTLQVLDYGVLVISGADGVQGHVLTLWRLLKRYEIPVFLFVNKMDQEGTDAEQLLAQLRGQLDAACVKCGPEAEREHREQFLEEVAMCSENLMEEYLETGEVSSESIAEAVADRKLFPVYFGSALRLEGVEELLVGIREKALLPEYPDTFGARVYKIARDNHNMRLTYLKVTGGTLRVKMPVSNEAGASAGETVWEEKADQLRIYQGAQYTDVKEVSAGGICAVTGLTQTYAGQGLGAETEKGVPVLEPILTYQLILPEGSDVTKVLGQMKCLEEEEPQLQVLWKESLGEIHVQVMGEVQIEVLKSILAERFGLDAEFGTGSIVYKETLAEPVVGIGHFEPLRHYAEVQLLLEPGEPGSGLQFVTACSEDILDKNWQRLIQTHVEEKRHVGVLTGAEVTDLRIVLLSGRAHQKHTEGGDFRQSTYRAVRQGLRCGKNVLLEPVFAFRLEVPTEVLGRAMADIQRMHGSFEMPETEGNMSILTGQAPVATMQGYQREVNSYTRGRGRFSCSVKGYEPCHNAEEVIAAAGYDPETDLDNPTGSVFCAHGAGFVVDWDKVSDYAHMEVCWKSENDALHDAEYDTSVALAGTKNMSSHLEGMRHNYITQEEIDEIFSRTYGKKKEEPGRYRRYHRGARRAVSEGAMSSEGGNINGYHVSNSASGRTYKGEASVKEQYLLVDGYNIIFAWDELRELASHNIDSARDRLMDICSDYQGSLGCTLILVFDAYKVKGNPGSVTKYHNIYVVYTKEAETADQYIEKTVREIAHKYQVTVATSDALEQMIIWGAGAFRMSAAGFREAVEGAKDKLREDFLEKEEKIHYRPFEER